MACCFSNSLATFSLIGSATCLIRKPLCKNINKVGLLNYAYLPKEYQICSKYLIHKTYKLDNYRQIKEATSIEELEEMEPSACEDLKAFERRLVEVVSSYKPPTLRWRIVLAVLSLCTAISAWYWLRDPRTTVVPLTESLWIHPVFTFATITLIILFIFGIQKLVIAPQIITARMRTVLIDFNMSCDDSGKLILKPRQNNNSS